MIIEINEALIADLLEAKDHYAKLASLKTELSKYPFTYEDFGIEVPKNPSKPKPAPLLPLPEKPDQKTFGKKEKDHLSFKDRCPSGIETVVNVIVKILFFYDLAFLAYFGNTLFEFFANRASFDFVVLIGCFFLAGPLLQLFLATLFKSLCGLFVYERRRQQERKESHSSQPKRRTYQEALAFYEEELARIQAENEKIVSQNAKKEERYRKIQADRKKQMTALAERKKVLAEEKRAELQHQLDELEKENRFNVPEKYIYYLGDIIDILKEGRATSWKEAIKTLEEDQEKFGERLSRALENSRPKKKSYAVYYYSRVSNLPKEVWCQIEAYSAEDAMSAVEGAIRAEEL